MYPSWWDPEAPGDPVLSPRPPPEPGYLRWNTWASSSIQNGDPWTLDEGVAKQEDEWILFHDMLSGVDVPEEVAICWPDFVRVDVMGPCEDGVTVDRTNKHQTLPSRNMCIYRVCKISTNNWGEM
ncbi:uncharacterized protein LOC124370031 isoform X4 [Homalodisca vitripennis]|uniref:uncharacterized protein LOC124370031 isoform X4 n=1 Tax=Homalodisca vitripennis TaxID=197043 RepID=UPI001EEBE773|nr:uncharacterized protein LOC124370031 isoform X4 [Homalodisca vitripennis]